MSDDDEDELAQLRAQRAARAGGASTLSELREQQRLSQPSTAAHFLENSRSLKVAPVSTALPTSESVSHQVADEDEEEEDAAEEVGDAGMDEEVAVMQDEMRIHFPMAFGQQEQAVAKLPQLHAQTKRAGPPRPAQKSSLKGSGPARPMLAISIAPVSVLPSGIDVSQETVTDAGNTTSMAPPPRPNVGPVRPPPGALVPQAPHTQGPPSHSTSQHQPDHSTQRPKGPTSSHSSDPSQSTAAHNTSMHSNGPGSKPAWHSGSDGNRARPDLSDDEDGDEDAGGKDSEGEGEEEDPYQLPVTHEVTLAGHEKSVVCMDVEHSGSRLLTGSMDYTVRIYDFAGMKSDLRSFREIEPSEGHPVHALSWSPSGDAFLAVTGASQAKIYDRDGRQKGEFIRGDMYIRDMKNTKGHVSGLCSGQWHPTDKTACMTCSEDGTVRIWDATAITQKTVIKPTLAKQQRTSVTACSYSSDGTLIGAGLIDGSIQIWNVAGKFGSSAAIGAVGVPKQQMVARQNWNFVTNPKQLVRNAHEPTTEVCSLSFSQDDRTLLSRGMDGTMKVWDLRNFKEPVHTWDNLPCGHPTTKAIFSPDESIIATGVTNEGGAAGDTTGSLCFFDRKTFAPVRTLGMPGGVTALLWHHRLNQIFAGVGTRKTGSTKVLYDTAISERGIMQCVARAPRKVDPLDYQPPMIVKSMGLLPLFREDPGRGKRHNETERVDPAKARKPDPGSSAGVGKQGRIGMTGKTILTLHIMKKKGKLMATEEEEDPREAMLRHDPNGMTAHFNAYAKTQPVPMFAPDSDEEGEDGDEGGGS